MADKVQRIFNLKSRVVAPTVIPYTLEGEDIPAVLDETNSVIDSKFKGNPNLRILNLRNINGDKVLVGSNSLILPIIQIAVPSYRPARPEEIETTLQEGDPVRIKGNHYVDYSIAIDFSGRDHDLAVEIFKQLPKELRDLGRLPALMVGYGLRNSKVGRYGVAPKYQEGTELRTAKILAESTNCFDEKDSELTRSGLPSKLGKGKRTLYNASQNEPSMDNLGLSRLYLGRNLDLCSWYGDGTLAYSNDYGRVVLVRTEGASAPKKAK